MRSQQARRAFAAMAPQSKLIRVIEKLHSCTDFQKTSACQQQIQKLNLRHSLQSAEGRLEFFADLLTETRESLSNAERRALSILCRELCAQKGNGSPFLGFSIEYLQQTLSGLDPCTSGRFVQTMAGLSARSLRKAPAASLLLALSLGSLVTSGCTQKKQSTQAQPVAQSLKAPDPGHARHIPEQRLTYVVQKGDSVRSIAQRLGLDYQGIVDRNNIKYDAERDWFVLHPGQALAVPSGPVNDQNGSLASQSGEGGFYIGETNRDHNCAYHLIGRGETLSTISKKYRLSVQTIAAANNISDIDKISYGAILRIPADCSDDAQGHAPFNSLSRNEKVQYLKDRTIMAGHPFLETIVDMAEEYQIDPRLYAALVWEESWFDAEARSADNCTKLVQLDPRFHAVSHDTTENFRKSLNYLRYEFTYYRRAGFDRKSATICALAAYNGGNTRIRRYINEGLWDGKNIDTIPLKETRDHINKIVRRCQLNYQARL